MTNNRTIPICALALFVATAAHPQTFSCPAPIRFHIVALSDSDGTNGPTFGPNAVQPWIDAVNNILGKPVGFTAQFRPDLDWETRADTDMNNGLCFGDEIPSARANADSIVAAHPGKIVVFLRRSCTMSPSPILTGTPASYSAPPDIGQPIAPGWGAGVDFVVFQNNFVPSSNDGLFAHEVGHYLGLYHTHIGTGSFPTAAAALSWLLSGHNMDGDLISDTPEDPSPAVVLNCAPSGTVCSGSNQCWTYTPDRANVMSYYLGCTATSGLHISAGQAAKIRATLSHPSRSMLCQQPCWPNFHNFPAGSVDKCLAYWKYREGYGPEALTVDWTGTLAAGTLKPNANGWYKTADRNDYESWSQFWPWFGYASSHYDWRPSVPLALGITRSLPGASSIQTFHRMDVSSFSSQWNQQFSAHRALIDVSVTSSNPIEISAVWAFQGGNTSATYFVNNDADLKSLSNSFYGNGIRLDRVVPIANGAGHTYLANWNASKALRGVWSVPNAAYQSLYDSLAGLGYSLHDIEYFENAGVTSVWEAPHNECTPGSRLHHDTDTCVKNVCDTHQPFADSYCCAYQWDSICVSEATSWCGRCQ